MILKWCYWSLFYKHFQIHFILAAEAEVMHVFILYSNCMGTLNGERIDDERDLNRWFVFIGYLWVSSHWCSPSEFTCFDCTCVCLLFQKYKNETH
jgi:hypothetical protein